MMDIVDRLMNFERCGNTALERVELREQSAIEIFSLRSALEAILKLNGKNDLPAAWVIARKELARSKQFCTPGQTSKLNSIDSRLERMLGRTST